MCQDRNKNYVYMEKKSGCILPSVVLLMLFLDLKLFSIYKYYHSEQHFKDTAVTRIEKRKILRFLLLIICIFRQDQGVFVRYILLLLLNFSLHDSNVLIYDRSSVYIAHSIY